MKSKKCSVCGWHVSCQINRKGVVKMSQHIDSQMKKHGYVKVQGMAVLNDVAVTETSTQVLSPRLSTEQAVEVFNNEFGPGWDLYRKVTPSTLSH